GSRRSTTSLNFHFRCLTAFGVQFPDSKIVLENDLASIIRDARPDNSPVAKIGNASSTRAPGRHTPNILSTVLVHRIVAIGNVEETSSVCIPHGPHFFSARFSHTFICS